MRVVIDTNCLIAAIPRLSDHYWLYTAFTERAFDWVVSQEILTEYEEKLSEFYSPSLAQNVLKLLASAPHVIHVEASFKWLMVRNDPDDDKFADVAFASGADYLVSNDSDFNVLKEREYPQINVIRLDHFKHILAR
ncbi:putative toxin-antitoxin system toxin component, PIN family [Fibrella sp. HMF5335]|uniref:Toxin-antitoxin system toxin component, PIN family n=1 Tax=Fibrella rubiginis TaxID=2817060 RepID=A0A939GCU0_9BACT|nr:putative toxin-antitoxin system toxin component, PIN family [Fibrella rubiginis]MBO0936732.1 putative toxin-antitoxin system toxin component, PIN family [Fibrella rubiginis]